MPETNAYRRVDRPVEGFTKTPLPGCLNRPICTYLPTDYQPLYPYPLVVLFHAHDGNEELAARLAPRLSRRNYVAISIRAPLPAGRGDDGRPRFRWDRRDEAVRTTTEEFQAAVEATRRTYHIHAERVFLVGVNEGVEMAYRVGLGLTDRIAGIVALNGMMPRANGVPVFKSDCVRRLPVFIGHGKANPIISYSQAKLDYRLLFAAGADVRLMSYPTTHLIHPNMLRDVNRWIIGRVIDSKSRSSF